MVADEEGVIENDATRKKLKKEENGRCGVEVVRYGKVA